MTKLVIKDNKVLATHDNNQEVENLYKNCQYIIDDNWNGEIGDNYEITDEQLAKIQATKNITKRQLLIWLYSQKDKTENDILSAIELIQDEAQKYLAKVNYIGTNNFYYGNDFVLVIGQALGLSVDEIKTMFDEASKL